MKEWRYCDSWMNSVARCVGGFKGAVNLTCSYVCALFIVYWWTLGWGLGLGHRFRRTRYANDGGPAISIVQGTTVQGFSSISTVNIKFATDQHNCNWSAQLQLISCNWLKKRCTQKCLRSLLNYANWCGGACGHLGSRLTAMQFYYLYDFTCFWIYLYFYD